jgi:hypothetical protein
LLWLFWRWDLMNSLFGLVLNLNPPHLRPPSSTWQLYFFSFAVLGLDFRAYALSHFTSPFLWQVFWDRVLWTVCLGWFLTVILLISASWVARITGLSHWLICHFLILKTTLEVFCPHIPDACPC